MDDFEPVPQSRRPPEPDQEEEKKPAPPVPKYVMDQGAFQTAQSNPAIPPQQEGSPAIPPQPQPHNPFFPPYPQQGSLAVPPAPQNNYQQSAAPSQDNYAQQAGSQTPQAQVPQPQVPQPQVPQPQPQAGFVPVPQQNVRPQHYAQSSPAPGNLDAMSPAMQAPQGYQQQVPNPVAPQPPYPPQQQMTQPAPTPVNQQQQAPPPQQGPRVHFDDEDDDDDDDELQDLTNKYDIGTAEWTHMEVPAAGVVPLVVTYLKHYQRQARFIILKPHDFFSAMPLKGVAVDATKFLGVSGVVFGLAFALLHLQPLSLFPRVAEAFITTAIGAAIAAVALPRLGGKSNIEATYAVFAYSRVTYLIAWFALGAFPVGGVLAMAYSVWLNIVGLERVSGLPRKMLASFCCVLCAIGLAFRSRFNLL